MPTSLIRYHCILKFGRQPCHCIQAGTGSWIISFLHVQWPRRFWDILDRDPRVVFPSPTTGYMLTSFSLFFLPLLDCGVFFSKGHFTHESESPWPLALQALSLVEMSEPVQVCFTLRLRDHRSVWMQDGCRVDMDSYVVSNGSCFMVTWTIFKNCLLEVGLTQNWETVALRTLITVGLFYFIMCEVPAWIEIHWNSIWLRVRSHVTSHYTWGSVTALHGFGGDLGRPLDTFFWALTILWSRLLVHVWSGPKTPKTVWR